VSKAFGVVIPLAACCFAVAIPARAAAPTTDVVHINSTSVAAQTSAACGFTVLRHVEGTLVVRTFYDNAGGFRRELDQYHLVQTLAANGNTLVGHTDQNIHVVLLPDGSFTVAYAGTDARTTVPGAGISFGSAGRLLEVYDADGNLVSAQDVGDVRGDFAALCAALAA
jgi:hypothetical protein